MIVKLILTTLVYPGLAATLVWWVTGKLLTRKVRAGVNALVICLAYGIIYLGLEGFPGFPPVASLGWLFYWVFPFGLLGWMLTLRPWPRLVKVTLCFLLAMPALYFVLRSTVQYTWEAKQAWVWLTGLSVVVVTLILTLDFSARTLVQPFEEWLFLGGVLAALGCLSLALGMSGSVKLMQLGGGMGFVLFLHGFCRWRSWCDLFYHGGGMSFCLVYLGLILNGHFYSELPLSSAILLVLCPLLPNLLLLVPIRKRSLLMRVVTLAGLFLVCGGLAVGLAFSGGSDPADYYNY